MSDRSRGRRRLVLWLVAAVVLVVCCGGGWLWASRFGMPFMEPRDDGLVLYVRNDRPQAIKIRIVQPGVRTLSEEIPAGDMHSYGFACDATLIEATDATGYILGRIDHAGCTPQTWIITDHDTTRLVPGEADR